MLDYRSKRDKVYVEYLTPPHKLYHVTCSVFGSNILKELRLGAFVFIAFLDFLIVADLEAFLAPFIGAVGSNSDSSLVDLEAFWLLLSVFFGSDSTSLMPSPIGLSFCFALVDHSSSYAFA